MTRAEIEAAIASVSSEATSRVATDPLFAAGMHHAARMLREALAKSEAEAAKTQFYCLTCTARAPARENFPHDNECPYKVAP